MPRAMSRITSAWWWKAWPWQKKTFSVADGGDVVVEDAGVDRVGALAEVEDAVRA